jgi:hypothetical protein
MIDPSFVTKGGHWSSAMTSIFDFPIVVVHQADSAIQVSAILSAWSVYTELSLERELPNFILGEAKSRC